jgi:hypothetical protein
MTRPPDKKQELIERLTKLWNETAGLSHEETIDRLADFILVRDASITSEVSTNTSLDTEGLEKQIDAIILHIVYDAGQIERGKSITADRFSEQREKLRALFAQHTQVAVEEAELIERFRKSLMQLHSNDWSMETISEAAQICAKEAKNAIS